MPEERPGTLSATGRNLSYDFVRCVAMVFVVAVHALRVVDARGAVAQIYVAVGDALFLTANALFFMLSGKFNMRNRNAEEPMRYYLRKLRGVVLPVLVLFLARTIYEMYLDYGSVAHFLSVYLRNCLGLFANIEYWFMFSLISMLAAVPLLVNMVKPLSRRGKSVFLTCGVAWFAVLFMANNLGLQVGFSFILGVYWFLFVIGSFVEELFDRGDAWRWAAPAGLASVVACALLYLRGWSVGAFDNSPLYVVGSICVLLCLIRLGKCICGGRLGRIVEFCSKHSFTVYMVHIPVLLIVIGWAQGCAASLSYGVRSIPLHLLVTLVTVLLSLIVATLIDTLAIGPLQRLFDRLVSRLESPRSR